MIQLILTLAMAQAAPQVTYELRRDIPYREGNPDPKCQLDLYLPKGKKDFATVVWFHGGGLTGGAKEVPERLMKQGIAVIAAGYRLSPNVKAPAYIEDAAAAVAWTVQNIGALGGSTKKLFISGHSAGGYLASMVVLDKRWLKPHKIDPDTFAGLIPFSGQSITHYTVRQERGIPERQAVVDDLAPLYHVRKDAPPILLLSADREKELLGRYEESAYFWRMLKEVGHPRVRLLELQGYDHGGMADPGFPLLLQFMREREREIDSAR